MSNSTAAEAPVFVGIDLGWTTGRTGLAAVDGTGRLIDSGRVLTDDEIAAWTGRQPGRLTVVAVDAPLVVPNETGQRVPERCIGQAFGGFGASAHTCNRTKFGGQDTRGLKLAQRFGWTVDPAAPTGGHATVCIEVYPHPAMIGLFALPYRLDYKKGGDARRAPGFAKLAQHLESIEVLQLAGNARWQQIRQVVAAPAPGDLNRVEDELDAILCAHLAWLWHHHREALQVYGSLAEGYIVAPPPPPHPPVPPTVAPRVPTLPVRPDSFERTVVGRPTGYAAGENERRWKRAVGDAFAGCVLPADARVEVVVDFVLGLDQREQNEPDLDNLIKSTVDALVGVIGVRPGSYARQQADDVRIDRITASKRPAREGEDSGARLVVSRIR